MSNPVHPNKRHFQDWKLRRLQFWFDILITHLAKKPTKLALKLPRYCCKPIHNFLTSDLILRSFWSKWDTTHSLGGFYYIVFLWIIEKHAYNLWRSTWCKIAILTSLEDTEASILGRHWSFDVTKAIGPRWHCLYSSTVFLNLGYAVHQRSNGYIDAGCQRELGLKSYRQLTRDFTTVAPDD